MVLGFCIVLAFSGLKWLMHESRTMQWLEREAYLWMQAIASASGASEPVLRLTIVDITGLKPESPPQTAGAEIGLALTPRAALTNLLQAIAGFDPRVIGLDIDFSPEDRGSQDLETIPFLAWCRALTNSRGQPIPVFLGVRRSEAFGPTAWLGNQYYAKLAASISRPKGLAAEMPKQFSFGPETQPLWVLRSMGHALADPRPRPEASPPFWWRRFVEDSRTQPVGAKSDELRVEKYYVDYSRRRQLELNRLAFEEVIKAAHTPTSRPEVREKLESHAILVGDATPGQTIDPVIVPGAEEPVPGVYAHACAANTLAEAPLYRVGPISGSLVSLLVSAGGIWLVYTISKRAIQKGAVNPIPLTILLTFFLLGVLLVGSAHLMIYFHTMWLDVFAVAAALLGECLVEIFISSVNWRLVTQDFAGLVVVAEKEEPR